MTKWPTWSRQGLALVLFGVCVLSPAIPVSSQQALSPSRLNPKIEKIVAEDIRFSPDEQSFESEGE